MTEWDDLWEGKAIWEANEETLTWIMKVKSVGDKLKEQLRDAKAQFRVNDQHRMLYQSQRDNERQKLEAIREIVNRVDTDSDKVYNVKKALDK